MAEGKILGVPSVKCDSCDEGNATHFCIECDHPMCSNCTKIHGRIPSTKTHKITQIDDYKLLTSTTKGNASNSHCAKHQENVIDKLCEDCLTVVCSECEPDHKGHKLNDGSFEANFLQRVCAQKVPGLLEILHDLKDLEDGSQEKIRLYKEAENLVKSWKGQLLDLLTKDADRLLGEIRVELKKHEEILADSLTKTKENVVKTDRQMTKMSESWKISNTAKLLDQMSKCDKEMEEVKKYIDKVKASHTKNTVKDILPYKDEFHKAANMVKKLLTKADENTGTRATFSTLRNQKHHRQSIFKSLKVVKDTRLPKTIYPLRLCGEHTQTSDQFAMFELGGKNIHVYDISLNEIKTCVFSKNILKMVKLDRNRYVITDVNRNVYLVNEEFQVIENIAQQESGYKPYGLCATADDKCIVSEVNDVLKTTRFQEISVNGDIVNSKLLCEKEICHYNGLLEYHDTGFVSFDDTNTNIVTINLNTEDLSRLHTSKGDNLSLCRDGENVLVGTEDGCVYKVTHGKRSSVVLQGLRRVNGLRVTDSGVLVISGDNLQIYQP